MASFTRIAEAAIPAANLLVKTGSGATLCNLCGASDTPIGVAARVCRINELCTIEPLQDAIFTLTASGSIAFGDDVQLAASGKVATFASGTKIGSAVSSASDGELVQVSVSGSQTEIPVEEVDTDNGLASATELVQASAPYYSESVETTTPVSFIFGRDTFGTENVQQGAGLQWSSHAFGFINDRASMFWGRQEPGWVFGVEAGFASFDPSHVAQYSSMGGWKCTAWCGDDCTEMKGQSLFGYANYGAGSYSFAAGNGNYALGPSCFAVGADNTVGGKLVGTVVEPVQRVSAGSNYTNWNATAKTLRVAGDVTATFPAGTVVLLKANLSTDVSGIVNGARQTWGIVESSVYGTYTEITLDRAYTDSGVDLHTAGIIHPVIASSTAQASFSGAIGVQNVVRSNHSIAIGSGHYIEQTNSNSNAVDGAIALGSCARPSSGGSLVFGGYSNLGAGALGQRNLIIASTGPMYGTAKTATRDDLRIKLRPSSGIATIEDGGRPCIPANSTMHMRWTVVGRRVDTGAGLSGSRTVEHSAVATFDWTVRRAPNGTSTSFASPSITYATGSSALWAVADLTASGAFLQAFITVAVLGNSKWEFSGDTYGILTGNSTFDNVTGLGMGNTGDGKMWAVPRGVAGAFYLNLYKDSALGAGNLVGHTATFAAASAGLKAVTADGGSGLGGTMYVYSVTEENWLLAVAAGTPIVTQVFPVFINTATIESTEIIEPSGGV